ncbi:MAG: hypothetical protein U5K00_07930 [Melioribacteraceae bacterium]|nr:hypothetical protein [Melioribacteraceae bacterium]
MKNNFVFFLSFLLLTQFTLAQSDYEKVQNFKAEVEKLSNDIDNVKSLEGLDSLKLAVSLLEKNYADDKELLDKSLYPDNFTSTFEKLSGKIISRRENFSDVGDLQAKVVSLQNQLDQLSDENSRLLKQIKEYQKVGGTDRASVNELRRLVSDLRTKLKQRDELVRSIVDSLLSDYVRHPMSLNDAEKQAIYEKVETGNLFYNIERTVRDNLEYLKVSTFTPEQLSDLKEDQSEFYKMWKRVGPRLAQLYKEQGDQTGEVAYISNMFSEWEQKLDERIWGRIEQAFSKHDIKLSFDNGKEFTQVFVNFIEEKSDGASEVEYKNFRDSLWIAELKVNWLPKLIDNEMLTVEQRDQMEEAVESWEAKYESDTSWYWYVLIGFVLLIFLLILIPKWKNSNKPLSEQ